MARKSVDFSNRFKLIDNYIYIYHLNKYVIIPTYPEQIVDKLGSTFGSTNILARTAPIYAYSYSGPRSIQFDITLHRDLMTQLNYSNASFVASAGLGEDYVDVLIKALQAMALPKYKVAQIQSAMQKGKLIDPPMAAVRFGNTIFIKGVVTGDVSVSYSGPIDSAGKYQQAVVSFTISETDPQDADSILEQGSFRSLETVLSKGLLKG